MDEKKLPPIIEKAPSSQPEKPPLEVPQSEPSPQNVPAPAAPTCQAQRVTASPAFTKPIPNDVYRRLLPAALFLLTFVTVMTMLLMYMDTTALRAQQFRVNMTHDYELRRIAQDDPSLVAYVRQLHLGAGLGRSHHHDYEQQESDAGRHRRAQLIRSATDNKYNGTFVEVLVSGARDPAALWLERARGWRGLVVRADPKDYLTLRAAAARRAPALHACLSPVSHPKEVTYYESAGTWKHDGVSVDVLGGDIDGSGFSSRVYCFPLYTLLLVGNATHCDYLLLSSPGSQKALSTLPFDKVHVQLLEIRLTSDVNKNATTEFLREKGYKVKAEFEDSVLYEKTNEPTEV